VGTEFTRPLALARHALHRQAHLRSRPDLLADLTARESTRVLPLWQGKAPVADEMLVTVPAPAFFGAVGADLGPTAPLIFLGASTIDLPGEPAGTVFLSVNVGDEGVRALALEHAWCDLREVGSRLNDRDAGLFTQALALVNWHASSGHSPHTGEPTVPTRAGWARELNRANVATVFPRTDPAIIVLVTDAEDRILLGNNALWEPDRYSLPAGYVEPGESLEAAVIREVFEEAGVPVVDPEYLGSQPWPFPSSLMLGFRARLAPGIHPDSVVADGEEIKRLRWVSRDELRAELAHLRLPGPVSIARALIERWFGEPLEQGDSWLGTR
jgi:NAD+ diphosphatase